MVEFSYFGSFLAHPESTFLFSWIIDLVNGFVKTFRKSGGLEDPLVSPKVATIAPVIFSKYPVHTSTVTRVITDSQLNMSWTVAQAKALLNSSLSDIWVKETMVLVTEVPMLAPMIMGMAVLTGTSAATKPTMMVVEVELDWTRTVTRTPIITPTTGLFNSSELANRATKKKS